MERAQSRTTSRPGDAGSPTRGRTPSMSRRRRPLEPPPLSEVLAPALSAAAGRALRRWTGSRRPSLARIARGALAGAGAAGVLYAYRRVIEDALDMDLTDELLAGAGRGVAYAAVLDPVIPGPPLVRGVVAGTVDYLLVPWGGLYSGLQKLSPARRIPVANALLETGDAEDDPYVQFLIYSVALALLHGNGPADE